MRRLPGQAVRATGRILHHLAALVLVAALGLSAVLAGLAWRLSEGPVDIPWLAKRMQAAANAQPGGMQVVIGGAELTWEGFKRGVDRPLDIRLRNVSATDTSRGHSVVVPQIDVSLALGGLLLGRLQPRALEIDSARLVLLRTRSGQVRLDFAAPDDAEADEAVSDDASAGDPIAGTGPTTLGPTTLGGLIAELARPPAAAGNSDRLGRFSQLRRVRIRNATFTVIDRKLDAVWRAEVPEIDLRRRGQGGMEGSGSFVLAAGPGGASVRVVGTLAPGDGTIRLSARVSDLAPVALARQSGSLVRLDALDAPVAGTLDLEIGPHQALRRIAVDLHAGAGELKIGPSIVRLAGGDLTAQGTEHDLAVQTFSLRVLGHDGGPVSTISGDGAVHRNAGRVHSELSLALDHVAFADLGQLWPPQIASKARAWIIENITAGIARDAHVKMAMEVNEDLSDPALISATGSLVGEGLTVYWLRPVAPIDHGNARLNILDPDTLEILVSSGRQTLDAAQENGQPGRRRESGLVIKSGKLRIAGVAHKDQIGFIDADIAGPVADAITLLRSKKLHLLARFPLDLNDPGGQLSGTLAITVPLEQKLQIEQVPIQAKLHLQDVHLASLVAGRDLDHGNVDIGASNDGLKLSGKAEIATIPTQLDAEMNFRPGPPGQVLQRVVVTGRATARQLAAVGLDAGDALGGSLALKAAATERRDGSGDVLVDADLGAASLLVAPIGWRKPAGRPATGQVRLDLRHGRLVGINQILIDGRGKGDEALMLRGRAAFADGRIAGLTIERAVFGRTDGHGTVRFPATDGSIELAFDGPTLDLSRVLSSQPGPAGSRAPDVPKAGPPWNLDARFDRAIMANSVTVTGLVAHAENDGRVIRALHVEAQTQPNEPHSNVAAGSPSHFRLDIAPPAGARPRTLSAAADDAGALLRAVDVVQTMQGGKLSVRASYDDTLPDHPLAGTAEIGDFRIQGAPALGRLLQAMTLYGLVDVMQGPGLGFSRLVAPFRLTREALTLSEARAFSSSLGLTVKGRIGLEQDRLDLEGTIVPAYFFNSLLGNLPLIGKLFSPEEGGGLFAASYAIRGTASDPVVSVNPLSALTPGFLRGLFGIF